MSIKTDIEKLKTPDIYSLMLFVLYQMRGTEEMSTLSELIYVLDKKSFLQLCNYFGGKTITIPTMEEMERLIGVLVVYEQVELEKQPFEKAWRYAGFTPKDKEALDTYQCMCNALQNFTFEHRSIGI